MGKSKSKICTKEYEEKWFNLLDEDEKNFSCRDDYKKLHKIVKSTINKKDVEESIFEVEFLYRKQINKNKLTGLISYPSILALISGAVVIYSLICQESFIGFIFLIVVLLILVFVAIHCGGNAVKKDQNNLYYYEQILKVLNKEKNKDNEKESVIFLRSWACSKRLLVNEKKLAKEIKEFLNNNDLDSNILIDYLRKIEHIYKDYLKDISGTEKFKANPAIEIQFYNSYILYIKTLINDETKINTEE